MEAAGALALGELRNADASVGRMHTVAAVGAKLGAGLLELLRTNTAAISAVESLLDDYTMMIRSDAVKALELLNSSATDGRSHLKLGNFPDRLLRPSIVRYLRFQPPAQHCTSAT